MYSYIPLAPTARLLLYEVPSQEKKEEGQKRSEDQQALLPTSEGIRAKPVLLVLCKPCNLLCLGLEFILVSSTDWTVPVLWETLRNAGFVSRARLKALQEATSGSITEKMQGFPEEGNRSE